MEMKVLRARLDRFHAKIDRGEVIEGEDFQEGKRMERLFQRYLRSMEDEAEEEERSVSRKAGRWHGWF